jgi:hypothetical protein
MGLAGIYVSAVSGAGSAAESKLAPVTPIALIRPPHLMVSSCLPRSLTIVFVASVLRPAAPPSRATALWPSVARFFSQTAL